LGNGLVDILAVGDVVFGEVIAEVARVVADSVDGRERNQVVATIQSADDHRTHGDLFHGAKVAGDFNDVILVHAVIQLNEYPGDYLLNQLLSPEADGQAYHPGPGNQWPDVDADLRQHDQHRHGHNHDGRRVTEQHQQRFLALAGEAPFPCTDAVFDRSEEHTSELQSRENLVCRLLLEKK